MAAIATMPKCWGHRGASADFPENTLASFESAARAGADGIESDVHITSDDYILMFHDPELGRTTEGGSGSINDQPYVGNIEKLITTKKPQQKIPTFTQTMTWFNRPENQHMVFNIDVKANNDPDRLFTLMRKILASESPDWERTIAPRLILGLWHPKFIAPAITILPSVKRCFIGIDLRLAQRPVFWDAVDSYSIAFPALSTREGRKFIEKCKKAGKGVYTWTCNRQEEWVTAAKWGIDVVMTDTPIPYMAERRAVVEAKKPIVPKDPWFMWKSMLYWKPIQWWFRGIVLKRLEHLGGPLAPYYINAKK